MLGSLVMLFYVLKAWRKLLSRTPQRTQAELLLAEGAVNTLSFKLAATLMKTIYIHTWRQMAILASIVTLRTLLKRIFSWRQAHLRPAHRSR